MQYEGQLCCFVSLHFFRYVRLNTFRLLWKLWISQWCVHEPLHKLLRFMSVCTQHNVALTSLEWPAMFCILVLFCPGGNSFPNLMAQYLPAIIKS